MRRADRIRRGESVNGEQMITSLSLRRGAVRRALLFAVTLVLIPIKAQAEHPWRFVDPAKVLYKISQSDTTKIPAWLILFVRDAADAWSETPTPLHLINCATSSCSVIVRSYHADDGAGGVGGCFAWDSFGYCAPNQGYVHLNVGCTGATCGPQETTPRYNKWIVMHELAHAIGLSHGTGKHSVTSYGSCTSEAWCVSIPNTGDANRVNAKYPMDWSDDGRGGTCSVIRTAQDHSGSTSTESSGSYWERLLGVSDQAVELAGQSAGKSGVDSPPIADKLTFHPTC